MSEFAQPVVEDESAHGLRVLQVPRSSEDVIRQAMPDASADEVLASMCSCVVHLCGCA